MKSNRDSDSLKGRWILFTAFRYVRSRRRERGLTTSILSVLGIGMGVFAIISVIGVMNGFQIGFIEDILEIRSYHVRLSFEEEKSERTDFPMLAEKLRKEESIRAVLPFLDIQVLLEGYFEDISVAFIRGIPPDAGEIDPGMAEQLNIIRGSMELSAPGSIVMGSELARKLGAGVGDTITLHALSGRAFQELKPVKDDFVVTGIFKSGYYEFDKTIGFIRMDEALQIQGHDRGFVLGLKLDNHFRDREVLVRLPEVLGDTAFTAVSWRDYNRSFFSALRLEKLVMTLLLSLIFIVVGVNIYHALKRTVFEKREEIGILRSLGASGNGVRWVFILEGMIIGGAGGVLGLLAGLTVAENIDFVFRIVEFGIEGIMKMIEWALAAMAGGGEFTLFSSSYYYLTEIPSKVVPLEVVLVFFFAVSVSTLAAVFASKLVTRLNPCEVLRYE